MDEAHCNTEYAGAYDCGGCTGNDDLYFIATDDGACKIGRSATPEKRLMNLQIGSHRQLSLLLVLPKMGRQERVWHSAFKHAILRGEWYALSPQLRTAIEAARVGDEWIATLAYPWADDDPERHYKWRDRIADIEESALCKFEAKHGSAGLDCAA